MVPGSKGERDISKTLERTVAKYTLPWVWSCRQGIRWWEICRHFPFVSQGSFWPRMLLIKPGLLRKDAQPHANCAGKNSGGVGCVGSLSEGYIPWQEQNLPAAEIWKPDEVVEKWMRLEGPHMKIWVTEREDETVVSSGNDSSSLLLISSYRIWSMQLLHSPLTYTLLNHKQHNFFQCSYRLCVLKAKSPVSTQLWFRPWFFFYHNLLSLQCRSRALEFNCL